MNTANAALVRRFYEEVFNAGQDQLLDEVLASDYLDFGGMPPREGIEAARVNLHALQGGFDDLHFSIDDLLADGDRVAVRWTGRMIHAREVFGFAPTGRTITFSGISIYLIRHGRIAETYPAQDLHGFLQQLGGAA